MTRLQRCLKGYYYADCKNDTARKKLFQDRIDKYPRKKIKSESYKLSENTKSLLFECWLKSLSFVGVLNGE